MFGPYSFLSGIPGGTTSAFLLNSGHQQAQRRKQQEARSGMSQSLNPPPPQRHQPYVSDQIPFYLARSEAEAPPPKAVPHLPLLQGLLSYFPEAKDTILSKLLKEHSAENIQIALTGIPKKNNTNKQTMCNPVTFTAIKVQLANLIKSFFTSFKDSKPELHKKLNDLAQDSSFFSEKNLKNQTVTLIKKHFRTPDLNKPLRFTITAQELVNLLRRKTEKLLTTPA